MKLAMVRELPMHDRRQDTVDADGEESSRKRKSRIEQQSTVSDLEISELKAIEGKVRVR